MFEKYEEIQKSQFQIEKQFKKEFGFTLSEAQRKADAIKEKNKEIYVLRCLLNNYDFDAGNTMILTDEQRVSVEKRLNELEY